MGGDKGPLHCGCLICVTALVCAEIDVAFHAAACGSARGGGSVPPHPRLGSCRNTREGFASIQIFAFVFVPENVS